jgi:MinD superfamily P-loop ATPase containing an inserted ferredoxin domain
MAKTWYPVIDYLVCKECGSCVKKCSHGVYAKKKSPTPVVIQPESCVDHCHGCGNLCPQGAITYVGDDTGWMPPNSEKRENETACCCGGENKNAEKKVLIEYLYLDLKSCGRCIGTDTVLDEVLTVIAPALSLAGYQAAVRKTEIETAEMAAKYKFLASPTIRVNGRDIFKTVTENACGCCSNISGSSVDCRTFEYKNETYEVPPKELIAKAVLQCVFGNPSDEISSEEYALPQNLKDFFAGKISKQKCSCTNK